MPAAGKSNEIRLVRVYDAPVSAVWDAWTVPSQVEQWWGPRGFTITTHSKDLRAGGTWRYTMHGPDGVDYPNLTTYHVVEPHRRLVYDHGATDDRPPLFRVTVTFTEAKGKTRMEMVSSFASADVAAQMGTFIKQAGGNATWDRLAEHLDQRTAGRQTFVVARTFEAPIALVFEMWANPAHLVKWLPPAGSTMRFLRPDIAAGKSALFVMTGEHGTMHGRAEYLDIEAPHRIVYLQQFVDADERPEPAPFGRAWPHTLKTTVLFSEEAPGRTRVTVTSEPHAAATPAEVAAFVAERAGMTRGWSGSFDALDALLELGTRA
jgi:uncharacterized protein YndB with AHSA1/START domain